MTIIYRDDGPWGTGKGADLTAVEIDGNFSVLDTRLSTVEANPPQPNNIAAITPSGTTLTFTLDDGTEIAVAVPVLQFRWRGEWQPSTDYAELDVVRVTGVGLYAVQIAHTSAATFDEGAVDGNGSALYFKMFGFSGTSGVALADLTDVAETGLAANDMLVWDGSAHWANKTPTEVAGILPAFGGDTGAGGDPGLVPPPAAGDAAAGKFLGAGGAWLVPAGGSGGSTSLAGLSDVDIVAPGNNYILQFQSSDGKWHAVALSAIGGTVTQIETGTGLTGGPITTTGTVQLASIAAGRLLANIGGSSAAPGPVSLSALLDALIGSARGNVLRRDATGWSALAPGSAGQYLKSGGAAADVSWDTPAGAGTVTEIDTGTGLTGGPVTGSGTISLDSVTDGALLANTSGSAAAPIPTTLSLLLDHVFGSARGSMAQRGASGWGVLPPGVIGYFLQTQGVGADATWASIKTNRGGGSAGTTTTNWKEACRYATTANLAAAYSNGSSGVGATLTATANGAFALDGASPSAADRILVKDQSTLSQNGAYSLTTVGDGATPWVLTRVTDYDEATEITEGTAFLVLNGTVNSGSAWVMIDGGTLTIGTSAIEFEPVAGTLPDCDAGQVLGNPNAFSAPPVPTSLSDLITAGANVTITDTATGIEIASSGGGSTGANPTATASDTAVNGSATTFMRSDAAPAVQLATTSLFGLVKPDGTTVTISGGVISASGGGTYAGYGSAWFNVKDPTYGAAGDGTTDDTTAIQAAIDAATAAGGGVIYFPEGIYIVGGALQDTTNANAQLTLPTVDAGTANPIALTFIGEQEPYNVISTIRTVIPYTGGSIIKGTLNTGAGGSLLGGARSSGTAFTNVHATFRNLVFRMPDNPVLTALNMGLVVAASFHNVSVDTGTYSNTGPTQPTTATSFGIIQPVTQNGVENILDNIIVVGFYNNYKLGEHTEGGLVQSAFSINSFVQPTVAHCGHIAHIVSQHCANHLVSDGSGAAYLDIDLFDIEHASATPSAWLQTTYCVDDASNNIHGSCKYFTVNAVGVSDIFPKNGGGNFACYNQNAGKIGAQVLRTTNQSIPTGVSTAAIFTSENFDTDNMHDNSTNNTRVTFHTAGTYLMNGLWRWAADTSGTFRTAAIKLNATTNIGHNSCNPPATGDAARNLVTTIWQMAIGDYVEFIGTHDATGALNAEFEAGNAPMFTVIRVGP